MKQIYICQIAMLLWCHPIYKTGGNYFVADTLNLSKREGTFFLSVGGEGKSRYTDLLWNKGRCESCILLDSPCHLIFYNNKTTCKFILDPACFKNMLIIKG